MFPPQQQQQFYHAHPQQQGSFPAYGGVYARPSYLGAGANGMMSAGSTPSTTPTMMGQTSVFGQAQAQAQQQQQQYQQQGQFHPQQLPHQRGGGGLHPYASYFGTAAPSAATATAAAARSTSTTGGGGSTDLSAKFKTLTPATNKATTMETNKKSAYKCLIDGKAVECDKSFEVINPSTGKAFEICPSPSRAQLDQAIAAAQKAFKSWSKTPIDERKGCLVKAAGVIKENIDALAELLSKEQGKPLSEARTEITLAAVWFEMTASYNLKVDQIPSLDGQSDITVERRPLGVCAGIVPWNFPVVLAVWKIAPATMCGNTIIIKPSPYTPLATLKMGELIKDCFPAGVLQILSGTDAFGAIMSSHPVFAKVSFTGSAATGQKVMKSAADTLKRITLELGGNDAAVCLKDVDVAAAAPGIFAGAMANSGQVCAAIKRVYVPQEKYEDMCQALAECASKAKVGDAFEEGVQYGPLNNKMQFDRVMELIADAKKNGAKVYAGGGRVPGRDGYFIQPTILGNVKPDSRIVVEEQFGPVLPVIPYSGSEDDAIDAANDTLFGLTGSCWGKDEAAAAAKARQLQAGTVWANAHLSLVPNAPFGGAKCSGIGCENGENSLDNWCQLQVVNLKKPAQQ